MTGWRATGRHAIAGLPDHRGRYRGTIARSGFAQNGEVQAAVVVMENGLAVIASLSDVMGDAHGDRARQSCHLLRKWRERGIPLKEFGESVACPRFVCPRFRARSRLSL